MVAVHPEFAYVIFVGAAWAMLGMWMGTMVGVARTKYDVKLPFMYAESTHKHAVAFNCYQRAHQNTVENMPVAYLLLFVGGYKHPLIAAAAGIIYFAGRLLFALGYQTGDPKARRRGSFDLIGLFILLGCTISTALSVAQLL